MVSIRLLKILSLLLKSIKLEILYPLYLLSFIIPRKKNLWLFGSHNNSFSDNSKYLFYYISDSHSEIESVWVTNNKEIIKYLKQKNYKVVRRSSLKGLWTCLKGKIYFYSSYSSDINFLTSGGAIKFNLWHGIPLKKIEYDIKIGKLGEVYNSKLTSFYKITKPNIFQKPDFLLSTAPLISRIFSGAFRIKQEQYLEFGYPRCEHFFWTKERLLDFIKEKSPELIYILEKFKKHKRVFIYMPTFREQQSNNINNILELERLNNFMVSQNFLIIIKQHPNLKNKVNSSYSNILILTTYIDMYPILPFTDLLITDYSSIFFDYMLLNKPIIFYCYDKDKYLIEERGFYFDYMSLVSEIGEVVEDFDMLIEILSNYSFKSKDYVNIKEKFWNDKIIDSSSKITNFCLSLCKGETK